MTDVAYVASLRGVHTSFIVGVSADLERLRGVAIEALARCRDDYHYALIHQIGIDCRPNWSAAPAYAFPVSFDEPPAIERLARTDLRDSRETTIELVAEDSRSMIWKGVRNISGIAYEEEPA